MIRMTRLFAHSAFGISLLISGTYHNQLTANVASPAELDISNEPTSEDWQKFIAMSDEQRQQLWSYFTKKGKKFKDWSWGWRLAWLRSCENNNGSFCVQTLFAGLNDRALVVRAEAATRLGDNYANSKRADVLQQLSKAYAVKRNFRGDRPMFVQRRILEAIKKIDGKDSALGQKLARTDDSMRSYWRQINKF